MSLKDEILALFITVEDGHTYYPSGYKDQIIQAGELLDLYEQEQQALIAQFVPHGYLCPKGELTSINFDGCRRLYVKKAQG